MDSAVLNTGNQSLKTMQQPKILTGFVEGPHEMRIPSYALAALAGMALHYGTLFVFANAAGAVPASTLGAIAGAAASFMLVRHRACRDRANPGFSFLKFLFIASTGIGVNAAILSLMVLSLPLFSSQMAATGCAFLTSYVLNDIWSIGARRRR